MAKHNAELLARAEDRILREEDNRVTVRRHMAEDPLILGYRNRTRLYKEAMKRALTPKEYWGLPPGNWKGTQHQWVAHKKQARLDA